MEFKDNLVTLKKLANEKLGLDIFKEHDKTASLTNGIHRFRSINEDGLYSLAKDISRITADSINKPDIKKFLKIPDKENIGSLKVLEKLIAAKCDNSIAHSLMSPLFGIYDLRLADAHLPSSDLSRAYNNAKIDENSAIVKQGFQMIKACADCFNDIISIINT